MAYYSVSAKPEVNVIGDSYFKRKAMEEQRQQADREFVLDVAKTGISAYTGFSAVQAAQASGTRDQARLDMEQGKYDQTWGKDAPDVPVDVDGTGPAATVMMKPGAAAQLSTVVASLREAQEQEGGLQAKEYLKSNLGTMAGQTGAGTASNGAFVLVPKSSGISEWSLSTPIEPVFSSDYEYDPTLRRR